MKRSKSALRKTSSRQYVKALTSACRGAPVSRAISPKTSPLLRGMLLSGSVTSTVPEAMKNFESPGSPLRTISSLGTVKRGRSSL